MTNCLSFSNEFCTYVYAKLILQSFNIHAVEKLGSADSRKLRANKKYIMF